MSCPQPANTAVASFAGTAVRSTAPVLLRTLHTSSVVPFSLQQQQAGEQLQQQQQQRDIASLHFTSSSSSATQQQDPSLPTVQINRDSTSVIITPPQSSPFYHPQNPSRTLNNIWLRDNCPCPKCFHAPTRQKLHVTDQIPRDMSVSSVQVYEHGLEVTWSKGLDISHVEYEEQGEEALLRAQPGHQSFYPWEMILTR
ncbi:hypothetical protein BGX29_011909 [Mortierella sp. GBA35]|nr:hypothetical protein BGX29_011909 [Mortierella sp. GBA35]